MAWASVRCKPQTRRPATPRLPAPRFASHATEALITGGRPHHLLQAHEPGGCTHSADARIDATLLPRAAQPCCAAQRKPQRGL
jgi:hypothetical protein